jgi:MarR family transcriptional regulator, organic hydroperoxide resistance regulator
MKSRPNVKGKARQQETVSGPETLVNLPLEQSVGYQIRMTHRSLQRYLQTKIEPHGVTLGMWYFLRALWSEDGLTQRELSRRIGTMEPTTLTAILSMERIGLVTRVRNKDDRRKLNIWLTPKAKQLKKELLPLAVEVVNTATSGFSQREIHLLLSMLSSIQGNLAPSIISLDPDHDVDLP